MRGILGKGLVRDLDVEENLGLHQCNLLMAFIYFLHNFKQSKYFHST